MSDTEYRFTPQAADDLFAIWSFIARDSVNAANRVEEAIYRACSLAAKVPEAGAVRSQLTRIPVRFWVVQPYRNYYVVYDPKTKPPQIIRILHGAQNVPSILV